MKKPTPLEVLRKASAAAKRTELEDLLAHQIRALALPKPEREHAFHPERKWRFDFAWPAFMIAVEVDGGTYSRGRHVRPEGFEKDAEKLNAAAELGWRVYRYTSGMIRSGHAVTAIKVTLEREATQLVPRCSRGHRVVQSTGDCSTVVELKPDPDDVRVFKRVSGPCKELP